MTESNTMEDIFKLFKDSCTALEEKYKEAVDRCDVLERRLKDEQSTLQSIDMAFDTFRNNFLRKYFVRFCGAKLGSEDAFERESTSIMDEFKIFSERYDRTISEYDILFTKNTELENNYRALSDNFRMQQTELKQEFLQVKKLQEEKDILGKLYGDLAINFNCIEKTNGVQQQEISKLNELTVSLREQICNYNTKLENLRALNDTCVAGSIHERDRLIGLLSLPFTAVFEDIYTCVIKLREKNSFLEEKVSSMFVADVNVDDSEERQLRFEFPEECIPQTKSFLEPAPLVSKGIKFPTLRFFMSQFSSCKKYLVAGVSVIAAAGLVLLIGKYTSCESKQKFINNNMIQYNDVYTPSDDVDSTLDGFMVNDKDTSPDGLRDDFDGKADYDAFVRTPEVRYSIGVDSIVEGQSLIITERDSSVTVEKVKKEKVKLGKSCGSKYTISSFNQPRDWSRWSCQVPDKNQRDRCFTRRKYTNESVAAGNHIYFGCQMREQLCCPPIDVDSGGYYTKDKISYEEYEEGCGNELNTLRNVPNDWQNYACRKPERDEKCLETDDYLKKSFAVYNHLKGCAQGKKCCPRRNDKHDMKFKRSK